MASSLLSAYSERFLMKTYGISSGPELLLVKLIYSEYSALIVKGRLYSLLLLCIYVYVYIETLIFGVFCKW